MSVPPLLVRTSIKFLLTLTVLGGVLVFQVSSAQAQWLADAELIEWQYENAPNAMVTSPPDGTFRGTVSVSKQDPGARVEGVLYGETNGMATVYASASAGMRIYQTFIWQGSGQPYGGIHVLDYSQWSTLVEGNNVGVGVGFGEGFFTGSDSYSSEVTYYPTDSTSTLRGTVETSMGISGLSYGSSSAAGQGRRSWNYVLVP